MKRDKIKQKTTFSLTNNNVIETAFLYEQFRV